MPKIYIKPFVDCDNLEEYINGLEGAYNKFHDAAQREAEMMGNEELLEEVTSLSQEFTKEIRELAEMAEKIKDTEEVGQKIGLEGLKLSEKRESTQEKMNNFLSKVENMQKEQNRDSMQYENNPQMQKAIQEIQGIIGKLAAMFQSTEAQETGIPSQTQQIDEKGPSR